MAAETSEQVSTWLHTFDDRAIEGAALGTFNVRRRACSRAASLVIKHIDETRGPGKIHMHGTTTYNRGQRAQRLDPLFEHDATVGRSYSDPIEVDGVSLSIGRLSEHKVVPWTGYRDIPMAFYIRELDGSEEDGQLWSPEHDVRAPIHDYRPRGEQPGSYHQSMTEYLASVRDDIATFDRRLVGIAEVLGIKLPTPDDVYPDTLNVS